MVEFKGTCDICGGGFSKAELHKVVRLEVRENGSYEVVGFGSGMGMIFVHERCLVEKGKRADDR